MAKELSDELNLPYVRKLEAFLANEKISGKTIYPKKNLIFNAFRLIPFKTIKVVILDQDPYHVKNQTHGLSFSVQSGKKHPSSLKNIFKELTADL